MPTRRRSKDGTAARGYGAEHQAQRKQALAAFIPGQPCPRCGHSMWPGQALDLDHTDDRAGYHGLAHARCNRSAGARKGNKLRGLRRRVARPDSAELPLITSRQW
jgi:hypothetical protein